MASIFDPDLVANKQPNWTDSSAHRQPVELKPDDRPDGTNCKPDASADLLTHKPVDLHAKQALLRAPLETFQVQEPGRCPK